MRTALLSALLALSIPAASLACEKHQAQNAAKPAVKTLEVAELTSLQKDGKATPVDANGPETRTKFGIIPGAVLLTSSSKYEPSKELPSAKDTKLVFYCANVKCKASHKAAERALEAGYTDVNVLPAGVAGWKDAGQKTELPRS